MKSLFFKRILWAVDVLEDLETQKNALSTAKILMLTTGAEVQPVFVLGTPYNEESAKRIQELEKEFSSLAESRLNNFCQRHEVPRFGGVKILIVRNTSRRKQVREFLRYAEEASADVILLSTHARKGMERLFVGSFAETLALESRIPLITVNPSVSSVGQIGKILFPTTFQKRLRPAFEQCVQFAKGINASVTLFYKELAVDGELFTPHLEEILKRDSVHRLEVSEQWRTWAMGYGVQTELHLDNKPGYPSSAILEFAKKNDFGMIAVASQADSISAALVGSMARRLIREAGCPVWIFNVRDQE